MADENHSESDAPRQRRPGTASRPGAGPMERVSDRRRGELDALLAEAIEARGGGRSRSADGHGPGEPSPAAAAGHGGGGGGPRQLLPQRMGRARNLPRRPAVPRLPPARRGRLRGHLVSGDHGPGPRHAGPAGRARHRVARERRRREGEECNPPASERRVVPGDAVHALQSSRVSCRLSRESGPPSRSCPDSRWRSLARRFVARAAQAFRADVTTGPATPTAGAGRRGLLRRLGCGLLLTHGVHGPRSRSGPHL